MTFNSFFRNFFIPKLKFAATSVIATGVDYLIYLLLNRGFNISEPSSHAISYACGMIVNFILQMRFVFDLKRKINHAFILSVIFSIIGYLLSNLIFNVLLRTHPFFVENDIIAKIIVTATIFFYNFYSKRFSFERKITNIQIKKRQSNA